MDDWLSTIIAVTGTVAIVILVVLIGMGMKLQYRQIEACENLGGVPIAEKGVYKLCGKPENFIKIEEK